jgi:predicted MFS family arabinose efflux permease
VLAVSDVGERRRQRLLWVLSAATFLIFFQAFMVAPLLPRLAELFGVPVGTMGLIVPAYLIPYGAATLAYGPLSDRFGRGRIILASLLAFVVLTALTAAAFSPSSLLLLRLLTGLGASGVVPIALALIGDLFAYEERGRPLGWLFGAMAGGMAFGSTAGVMLEPLVGWQGLFLGVAGLGGATLMLLLPYRPLLAGSPDPSRTDYRRIFAGYLGLLGSGRGRRTYGYVLLNAVFHSGSSPGWGSTSPGATASGRSASVWLSSATASRASCSDRSSVARPIAGGEPGCCPRASRSAVPRPPPWPWICRLSRPPCS